MLEAAQAAHNLTVRLADPTLTDADKKDAVALLEQAYSGLERAANSITAWGTLSLSPEGDKQSNTARAVNGLMKARGLIGESAGKLGLDAMFSATFQRSSDREGTIRSRPSERRATGKLRAQN